MKKILSLLAGFILIASTVVSSTAFTSTLNSTSQHDSQKKFIPNNDLTQKELFDTEHIIVNQSTRKISANTNEVWELRDDMTYALDTTKYAVNKDSFIKHYPAMKINVSMAWRHWMGVEDKSKDAYWVIDTSKNLEMDENDKTLIRSKENVNETSAVFVGTKWNGNFLEITLRAYAHAWKKSPSDIFRGAKTQATLNYIDLTWVHYDYKDEVNAELSKDFLFISKTSRYLNSTLTKSLWTGTEELSNLQIISNHVLETLNAILGIDYDEIIKNLAWPLSFDLFNEMVIINFYDLNDGTLVRDGDFPRQVSFYAPIAFSPAFNRVERLKTVMQQKFVLNSTTSSNIDDQSPSSPSIPNSSNYALVLQEFTNRLKQQVTNIQALTWLQEMVDYSINFDNQNSTLTVSFTDKTSDGLISNGQWVNQLVMPVEVILS